MKPIIPLQPIVTCFQTPPASLSTAPMSNPVSEEDSNKCFDNDGQDQNELIE